MGCCGGSDISSSDRISFPHGLGDVVNYALISHLTLTMGRSLAVHCHDNKKEVFEAAGIPYVPNEKTAHHPFWEPGDINQPKPEFDGSGSKVYGNIPVNDERLKREFWEQLCNLDASTMLPMIVGNETQAKIDTKLRGLMEPFILLHTQGSNSPGEKSIPGNTTLELYERLLDGMPGTIIILDWDKRVPEILSGRVRHIAHDFGHLSIAETAALMNRSALLIGIDSGPFHLSAMHPIPALGVFHAHYPSCYVLPSDRHALMVRNDKRDVNISRRRRWNVLEYPDKMPKAEDITKHALRMMNGPRYLRDHARIGQDVMIQQWVRDWCRQSTPLAGRADRDITIDRLFTEIKKRFSDPRIIETGCARSKEDWSAGYSTYLFAALLANIGGSLTSVDVNQVNLDFAKNVCLPWDNGQLSFVKMDSVQFLQGDQQSIDVLYLDSLDADQPKAAEHGLEEIKAAMPKLHEGSLIAFDDTTFWQNTWRGKGATAVPWLIEQGYRVIGSGYQVILCK